LLLPAQQWKASVSGRILDHEGKPLVNARVTYTNISSYSGPSNAPLANTTTTEQSTDSGTGRVYQSKTDKNGEFTIIGIVHGTYSVEITDSAGKRVYSGRTLVQSGNAIDREPPHILNVDLSTALPGQEPGAGESNLATGKQTKEQMALVRQENANIVKINRLMPELHSALDVKDWPRAIDLLQQLLTLDPNRWEFYQNLGTIQSNLGRYQDSVQSYQKGVDVAQKTLVNASDPIKARRDISGMMISEGDAYIRLDKPDDAVGLYSQAAAIAPEPAMAYFHACNAQANRGKPDAAIAACNQAIAADPTHGEFYRVLASTLQTAGQSKEALETYEKGVDMAKKALASQPDSPLTKNVMGQMLNAEGNLYTKMGKYDEAILAFAESAKVSAYAALPYFNLCATYYNVNRLQEAVTACNQAIASDPTMAEAYYLKASSLFGKGSLEKGKYMPPPETRAALNKYLELSPFSQHAQLVREMLDKLDAAEDADPKPPKPAAK
jgi:tetratricopeptide (TPR) repeat protein